MTCLNPPSNEGDWGIQTRISIWSRLSRLETNKQKPKISWLTYFPSILSYIDKLWFLLECKIATLIVLYCCGKILRFAPMIFVSLHSLPIFIHCLLLCLSVSVSFLVIEKCKSNPRSILSWMWIRLSFFHHRKKHSEWKKLRANWWKWSISAFPHLYCTGD